MAQVINTNTMSLNAQRNLSTSGTNLATTIQRLSSGLRINSAKDDAAGLAISERFSTQIRGVNQAARNANDGISLAQTAEGALGEIGNNLQRIRELSVQSRNATNSASDREALNSEVQLLKAEIQRVAEQTNFNGTNLLNGKFQSQAFQIGADQGQTIDIAQIANANIAALGNWNEVDTAGSVTATKAAGTGGAGAPGTTPVTLDLSGIDAGDLDDGFTFDLDGTQITVGGGTGRTAEALAADVVDAINAQADGLAAADGGNVILTNATTTDVVVDNFSNGLANITATAATPGTGTGTATFSAGSFMLTGSKGTAVEIKFDAAGSAEQRADQLVKAINSQSYNTGVSASLDEAGNVSMKAADGNFTIAATADTDEAREALLAQTGLTAGETETYAKGVARTGFADLDISTEAGADNAMKAMDAALNSINSSRADLGAIQNRFTSVVANLNTSSENMSAARSRIRDVDYASETAELTRNQILQQAGTAMLAQANQSSQSVLSLLQ
ncbi:flagellin [Stenotrophomonas tumulicola]|uniref:Flagellin n=1 Tax=Stenotrophomonas tumulicola TaxID=1685415 RepID=A0A7W3FKJ2_9GAMM|nr:flagellin [Stenotrophomonas tumulicola]MBA8681209.1 flagellin [Stenotrophomonas tumulicola]